MKKFIKNNLIGIIIGIIISGTVGVIAATTISSKNVTYQNKTVNNALDELYDEATTGKELVAAAITNKGVTTTSNDTYETMAANINSIDTDHTKINQKLNNLESKHNSDITSLTGSISNLNQSLTTKLSLSSFKVVTLGGNTNLNDLSECGIYSVRGGLNSPSGDWVIMMVLPINGDVNFVNQICFALGHARPFARAYAFGSWTDWVEL